MAETRNLNLEIAVPEVETSRTLSNKYNDSIDKIDTHSHAPSEGTPVPSAGLNINADLPCNGSKLLQVGGIGLQNTEDGTGQPNSSIYEKSGSVYHKRRDGTEAKIIDGAGATSGLTQSEVDARVTSGIAGSSLCGTGRGGGLSEAQLATLQGASQVDAASLTGRDLQLISDNGTSRSFTIPGVTVKGNGAQVGSTGEIDELDFRGTGISVTQAANQARIDIAASRGATGPQGPTGPRGPTGPPGPQGTPGADGDDSGATRFVAIENTPTDLSSYVNGQVLRINQPSPGRWAEVEGANDNERHAFGITMGADPNNAQPQNFIVGTTLNFGYSSFGTTFGSLTALDGGKAFTAANAPVMRMEIELRVTRLPSTGVPVAFDSTLTMLIRKTDLTAAPSFIYCRFYSGAPSADNEVDTITFVRQADNPLHDYHTYLEQAGTSFITDQADILAIQSFSLFTSSPATNDQTSNPLQLHEAKTLTTIDAPQEAPIIMGQRFAQQSPGLSVTRTDGDMRPGTADPLRPSGQPTGTFDLDVAANQVGEFHINLELTIAPASDVNMGFERNKANQTGADRQRNRSITVFASDLRDESVWTSSAFTNGLTLFNIPVYSLNTLAGTFYVLLVRDSTNVVGIYRYWDGAAGATGATFTAELRSSFTPSDAAAATGGGGLTQGQVDARVRALVADQAEQGNTARWPTSKVPTLANLGGLTAGQVSSRILEPARAGSTTRWGASKVPTLATLGGITQSQADARVNTLIPANRRVPAYGSGNAGQILSVASGGASIAWVAAASGGGGRSFHISGTRSSVTSITTSATVGEWSAWQTISTSAALTSGQAGDILIAVKSSVEVAAGASGGGDRIIHEVQVMRTRGSAQILISRVYGPRNLGNAGATFNDISRQADQSHIGFDTGQTGDIYTFQIRVASQAASRAITFSTAGNAMDIVAI